jgi:hypothetical protein
MTTILNYTRSNGLWNGIDQGFYSSINYYIGDDDGSNKRERAIFEFDIPLDRNESEPVYFNFEILSKFGSGSPVARRWSIAYPTSEAELGATGFLVDLPELTTVNQVSFSDSVGLKSIDVTNLLEDAISNGQPKFILALDDYNNYDNRYYVIDNTSNIPTLSYTATESNSSTVFFDHYFDFYNYSPYSRCQNNICIEQVFPSGQNSGYYEDDSPTILNIFSSNLNRNFYGENNLVSDPDRRIKVVSGFDMSSDFTLAIHAFTSGIDTTVFDNSSGIFTVTNDKFYAKSGATLYSRDIPNSSNELDVLIRRLDNVYRVYGLTQGIDDYIEFTPPAITPPTQETYLLPFVSGNLCELLYSSSGWSDSDLSIYFNARYSLESHISSTSGYIQSYIPYSSGYNEIPLDIQPTSSISYFNPFYNSLSLPARIDYNSIQSNSGFYLNLEYTSDLNFLYSGQFSYTNGYINFLSTLPSGTNSQVSIPIVDTNNQQLDPYDSIDFNSKIVLGQDGIPYSGTIKFHSLDINLNTFESTLLLEKSLDLTLKSIDFFENYLDFYTEGFLSASSGVDFFSDGINKSYDSLDFYLQNNLKTDNSLNFYLSNTFIEVSNLEFYMSGSERQEDLSIDFYTSGVFNETDSFDMFISGVGFVSDNLNLFTYNSEYGNNILNSGFIPEDLTSGYINNNFRMFIGGENYENSINMFIKSTGYSGTQLNMFIGGENSNVNKDIDFYIHNNSSGFDKSIDFFTKSSIFNSGILNMYIGREYESVDYSVPMFIKSNNGTNSGLDFNIEGSYFEYNNIDLYISGYDIPNNNINLFTHGF